jgi:hypothetical protein
MTVSVIADAWENTDAQAPMQACNGQRLLGFVADRGHVDRSCASLVLWPGTAKRVDARGFVGACIADAVLIRRGRVLHWSFGCLRRLLHF